ncbi:MAG: PepSY domain-containing protein [Geothrix sp.]|nr:PepSY domain-containing protein [Geothrix sp.]
MRSRHLALGLALSLVPALVLSAGTTKSRKQASGAVKTAGDAKAIAERETGGKAITARRIPLNGASGGWEVELRMPHDEKGWRCVIDADTRTVHTKTRIDQPGAKGRAEGPVRMIKGTR